MNGNGQSGAQSYFWPGFGQQDSRHIDTAIAPTEATPEIAERLLDANGAVQLPAAERDPVLDLVDQQPTDYPMPVDSRLPSAVTAAPAVKPDYGVQDLSNKARPVAPDAAAVSTTYGMVTPVAAAAAPAPVARPVPTAPGPVAPAPVAAAQRPVAVAAPATVVAPTAMSTPPMGYAPRPVAPAPQPAAIVPMGPVARPTGPMAMVQAAYEPVDGEISPFVGPHVDTEYVDSHYRGSAVRDEPPPPFMGRTAEDVRAEMWKKRLLYAGLGAAAVGGVILLYRALSKDKE